MLMYSIAIIVGLVLLIWGANLMVVGASATARNYGVSPMLVGLTIVGFATSAPEILVAIAAAWSGAPNLAIGNAIGSNIANIGLIGGATALAWPLVVYSQTMRREFPVMVAVSIVPVIFFLDNHLARWEGFVLLAVFAGFIYWIIQLGLRTRGHDAIEAEYESEIPTDMTTAAAVARIVAGLAALSIGAKALVWGSESIALELGVSNLIIGITVIAFGTSLPELAVSLTSARKGNTGWRSATSLVRTVSIHSQSSASPPRSGRPRSIRAPCACICRSCWRSRSRFSSWRTIGPVRSGSADGMARSC